MVFRLSQQIVQGTPGHELADDVGTYPTVALFLADVKGRHDMGMVAEAAHGLSFSQHPLAD